MTFRLAAALAASIALAGCNAAPAPQSTPVQGTAAAAGPVTVGIAAFNDFHGALEEPKQLVMMPDGKGGNVAVPAGGAAYLASALDAVRSQYANTLTVAAGDLISASPLTSSLYLDEPSITALSRMGLEYTSVGNHEFDRGQIELKRVQNGGCAKNTVRTPCAIEPFAGASYKYLAASTILPDGSTLFPAIAIKRFGTGARQVTVGMIGLTLKGTAAIVAPGGIKGITFADEATTINALVPKLKAEGADAIMVLIHEGGVQGAGGGPNTCVDLSGDIRPILDKLDPRVDIVVSGHTHRSYVCEYGAPGRAAPMLLTSAGNNGTLLTDIRVEIDPSSHRVVARSARNVVVQSEPFSNARGPVTNSALYPVYQPRSDIAAHVAKYAAATMAFSNRAIGKISGTGSKLVQGQLIADSQLAAGRSAGAQIAFMNTGGVRAPLNPAADGTVTFGDLYRVQPFGNQVMTVTLKGAQVLSIIEQSLSDDGDVRAIFLSQGMAVRYDSRRPKGSRLISATLDGRPIDPASNYRVSVSDFLLGGGDGFTQLKTGTNPVPGPLDIEAMEAWIKTVPTRALPEQPRAIDIAKP